MLLSAGLLATGLFFSACEDTVTPVDTGTPTAVTGVMALSSGDSSVSLKWTSSSYETNSNFKDMNIEFTDGSANFEIASPLAKGTTSVNITGLKTGTEYTFSIYTRGTDGKKSTAATIKWSPAKRWTKFTNGNDIKLYETSSSFASGLTFTATGPESHVLADANMWDLCLDTRNDSYDIGSPALSSYTISAARTTLIAFDTAKYKNVTALNDVFESASLNPTKETLVNFNGVTKGFMFNFKTKDGNYGRVLVKATGGAILQGTAPNRYVDLEISYNPTANKPYGLAGKAEETANK